MVRVPHASFVTGPVAGPRCAIVGHFVSLARHAPGKRGLTNMPETITIRRARPTDAAAMARQMAHPEVYSMLMQLPMPTEAQWRTRLERFDAPDTQEILFIAELDGQLAGSAGLHPAPQLRRRHCAHLGISVAPEAQRHGVGSALMQTLCDHADRWAQILRLELTVFADNEAAIRLYERFGFRREGLHRAYAMRDGRFVDTVAMARLHPNQPLVSGGGS
jgi:putative acetyltransferase